MLKSTERSRRLAHRLSVALLVALGAVYVVAKIDFFRRFDPDNVSGYLTGHWIVWVAMAILGGTGLVLAWLGDKTGSNRE